MKLGASSASSSMLSSIVYGLGCGRYYEDADDEEEEERSKAGSGERSGIGMERDE